MGPSCGRKPVHFVGSRGERKSAFPASMNTTLVAWSMATASGSPRTNGCIQPSTKSSTTSAGGSAQTVKNTACMVIPPVAASSTCSCCSCPTPKSNRAVAANAPFYTMPDPSSEFPFGLHGAPLPADAMNKWFAKPIVYLLGERDTEPRTQPISNGPDARLQGPHGFARGLGFFQQSLAVANTQNTPHKWRLEIVPNVGHSDAHMASHAVKYLLVE